MAKYKHNEDTLIVLADLRNRIEQLIEASQGTDPKISEPQIMAFQAVLTLIDQVKTNGHVFRGNEFFPDSLLPYVKTESFINPLTNKEAS